MNSGSNKAKFYSLLGKGLLQKTTTGANILLSFATKFILKKIVPIESLENEEYMLKILYKRPNERSPVDVNMLSNYLGTK